MSQPEVVVDLGVLDLESKDGGAQLRLSSLARFASSAEDDIATLQEALTQCKLTSHSKDRPWVVRGSLLRLELLLEIDCGFALEEEDALIRTLTNRLQNAKLWAQFGLSPRSVDTSKTASHCNQIGVCLINEDVAAVPSKKKPKPHKLGADVPANDVLPPEGISTVLLASVQLHMQIHRQVSRKRRLLERRHSETSIQQDVKGTAFTSNAATSSTTEPYLDYFGAGVLNLYSNDKTPELLLEGDYEDDTYEISEMLLLEAEDHGRHSEDSETLLELDNIAEQEELLLTPRVPSLLKRSSSEVDLEFEAHHSPEDIVLDLIDTAIRKAITGSSTNPTEGILVKSRRRIRPLAGLAPSLWCPGFLPAVAERAVFLPTIAHCLESVYSRSAGLNKSSTAYEQENLRPALPLSKKSTSVAIWRMMEKDSYHALVNKRLQPLSTAVSTASSVPELEDDLLDLAGESRESDPLHDEDDKDLLSCEDYKEVGCLVYDDLLDDSQDVDLVTSPNKISDRYQIKPLDEGEIGWESKCARDQASEHLPRSESDEGAVWTGRSADEFDEDMISLSGSLDSTLLLDECIKDD